MGLDRVPPPARPAPAPAGSGSGAAEILRLALAGLLLALLLWVLDAATHAFLFAEGSFPELLLRPGLRELAGFSPYLFPVGCFLLYSRRLSRARTVLELALQDARLEAEGERTRALALLDAIPNPIYHQDPSGSVVRCNTACAQWLGQPRELIIGRGVGELAGESLPALGGKEPGPGAGGGCECRVRRGDGTLRDLLVYRTQLPDGAGEVGVLIDITKRKHAEEEVVGLNGALMQQAAELQEANRELEAFSHAISHDLRTPLTKIFCSGQSLLADYREALDPKGLFFAKTINDGCLQLTALLDALLVLSRVTAAELDCCAIDLAGMARDCCAEIRLAEPGRRVDFRSPPGLPVQGDPQLLRIALENLMRNAWKYTARVAEPSIELGVLADAEGDSVYYLKDNGAGFDRARADGLFRPFCRLHSSQEFPGTGLGLATVQRIIRRHRGRVWGEGKPGCGATFYFTLG